jgi:hypothetical protein
MTEIAKAVAATAKVVGGIVMLAMTSIAMMAKVMGKDDGNSCSGGSSGGGGSGSGNCGDKDNSGYSNGVGGQTTIY